MTSINVSVSEAKAHAKRTGKLTVGMVGVTVSFSFDDAWDGLEKYAVFRSGNVTRDRALLLSNETTVPHEVLYKAEEKLYIGVEGRGEDGALVIPTTWADAGVVLSGANAIGAEGKDPTPNAYDDIMAAIRSGALRGPEGPQGPKGDTPVKGVDYHTMEDRDALVETVASLVKTRARNINMGKLTAAEKLSFSELKPEDCMEVMSLENNLKEFATWAYANANVDVSEYFGTVESIFAAMFDTTAQASSGNMYKLLARTEVNKNSLAMLVPGSYGGNEYMKSHGYHYRMSKMDFCIGDIFCSKFEKKFSDGTTIDNCVFMAVWLFSGFLALINYGDGADEPVEAYYCAYEEIEDIVNGLADGITPAYYYVLRPQNIAIEDVIKLEETLSQSATLPREYYGAILNTASGEVPAVNDASDYGLSSLILYGKTTQNGTPTPDAPVKIVSAGDSGSIGVTVAGKNLFDFQKGTAPVTYMGQTSQGTRNGYAIHMPAGTYTLHAEATGTSHGYIYGVVNDRDGNYKEPCTLVQAASFYTRTITVQDGDIIYVYDGQAEHSISEANRIFAQYNIQIEVGSVATDYEPYKGQAFTVSTPNSLPGMPVSSNGNYTDSNGQQWVCDEIDLARGVHIKRVDKRLFNSAEGWNVSATGDKYMFYTQLANIQPEDCAIFCNIAQGVSFNDRASDLESFCYIYDKGATLFIASNTITTLDEFEALLTATPLEVIFVAEAPMETPLSDTEIEAFKELHGYKPYTTVYSDCNAGMNLEYIADTKTYIDNRFTELAAAIVANT